MSVTTTANARLTATRHYLADYELHHSQPSPESAAAAPGPNETSHQTLTDPSTSASNPSDWETNWRRVPAYRPVVDQVDEQRNTYTSGVERGFVRVMFGGMFLFVFTFSLRGGESGWVSVGTKF